MLNWVVHYKNKYPSGRVVASENALDVWNADGDHAVALRKDGAGQWVCQSEEFGCVDCHDLAPIPKDARVFKVNAGKIGRDEKHEERSKAKDQFMDDKGRVKSCDELKGQFEFDEKQRLLK